MDQKSSKIDLKMLKKVIKYAKDNKLLKVKMEGVEIELHPTAFQVSESVAMSDFEEGDKLEMLKAQAKKEAEDILYFSAQ